MENVGHTITVVVLAKNEQDRIDRCLSSVSWADQIIVIDNDSTDKTVVLAKPYTKNIVSASTTDFSKLRTIGMKHATGTWVLYVDADEQVPELLRKEIIATVKAWTHSRQGPTGYYVKRKNYYLGHLWPIEDQMQRLFVRAAFDRWTGMLHETALIRGTFATLTHPLFHDTHRTLEEMVDKTNAWSIHEAALRYNASHPRVVWWRLLRVMSTGFWDSFIIKGGYRAGTVGWIESIYQAFSLFITYAKLWELQSA